MDESSSVDHDDSNICAVPSKHIEDNGKLFPLISFISSLKAVMIKFHLQIKLKLKSEVHKLLHNPLPQCYWFVEFPNQKEVIKTPDDIIGLLFLALWVYKAT